MAENSDRQVRKGSRGSASARIDLRRRTIAEFCRRHHIRWMALFGSVLRDDFTPESDVDVLVEFEPDHVPGLMGLAGIEIELSEHLGHHRVDMNTPRMVSKYYRNEVLEEAEVIYDET